MGLFLVGRFSMACRDAKTHKARKVNPLVLEDADDRALSAIGEGRFYLEFSRSISRLEWDSPKTPHEVYSAEFTFSNSPNRRRGSSCSRAFCETSYSGSRHDQFCCKDPNW